MKRLICLFFQTSVLYYLKSLICQMHYFYFEKYGLVKPINDCIRLIPNLSINTKLKIFNLCEKEKRSKSSQRFWNSFFSLPICMYNVCACPVHASLWIFLKSLWMLPLLPKAFQNTKFQFWVKYWKHFHNPTAEWGKFIWLINGQ